jgi:cephalosporin-C deacetylase
MPDYAPHSPELPEDFDAFWQEAVEEQKAEPLDYHRSLRNDFDLPGFTVETIAFRGMHGAPLHGWLAYPPGSRRLPAFLWIPPYGRESLLPNEFGTREGFVSLSFNFFGLEAFHQETYRKERGYFAEGAESPETWVFRTMFQNAMLAVRVLQAQIEADEDRIGCMGMSQGAGMSIWMGAWSPVVKAVCADMPFLGAMEDTLSREVYRYPLKELTDYADSIPLGLPRILHTVSYFDTMHQATRCQVPTHISLGEKDPASRPAVVESIYEALRGEKKLVRYEVGHDWHPEMVANNRSWLLEKLG